MFCRPTGAFALLCSVTPITSLDPETSRSGSCEACFVLHFPLRGACPQREPGRVYWPNEERPGPALMGRCWSDHGDTSTVTGVL